MYYCKHLADVLLIKGYRRTSAPAGGGVAGRREWLLWMFGRAGKRNSNNEVYQFWQQNNHPMELVTIEMVEQRLNYLHQNPVEAGFVANGKDYWYSSARDYEGEVGLLPILFVS